MGSATSPATIVYIPPKWVDITPLLYYSAVLWIFLLVVAVMREVINRTLILKRENRPRHVANIGTRIWFLLSIAYKNFRSVLSKWQIVQKDLIWNVVLPRCFIGALVCAFYCIDTVLKRVTPLFYFIQVVYGLIVLTCLVYDFVYEPSPLYFVFRPGTVVECITIPSLLLASQGLWLNFNFLQAYSILTLWYTLEQHEIVLRNATSLTRLYFSISLELATFVFITACGVHFFELLGDPGSLGDKTFQTTWANALYFAVVTLMTVGYGDFVPFTLLGRVWIVVHIIRAAYLVVREMDFFFQSEKRQRGGIEAYVETIESSHVVVTGHVKWEFLKQFIEEFVKEVNNANTKVVVLTASPTWATEDWDKFITRSVFYDYRVFYVDGTPLELFDLERARVLSARAVFVMSDPHRGDPYREDASTLKTILSIRKYGGNVPIYSFNVSQNSSSQFSIAMEHFEEDNWLEGNSFPNGISLTGLTTGNEYRRGRELSDMEKSVLQGNIGTQVLHDNESTGGSILDAQALDLYSGGADEEPLLPRRPSTSRFFSLGNSRLWQDTEADGFLMGEPRSGESLCTQELEMALLAENVYCNGLSTLIANLTLRFAPVPKPTDRSWLLEYKLGAQCCIFSFNIPEQFDGRTYKKVATVLQDYGIVILSVLDKDLEKWNIITVDTVLKANTDTMIISYHQIRLIPWIVENAIEKLRVADEEAREAEASHSFLQSFEVDSRVRSYVSGDSGGGMWVTEPEPLQPMLQPEFLHIEGNLDSRAHFPSEHESALDTRALLSGVSSSANPDFLAATSQPANVDEPGPSITKEALQSHLESHSDGKHNDREPSGPNLGVSTPKHGNGQKKESRKRNVNFERRVHCQRIFSNLHHIPDTLSGHVIVCLDGENSLTSLKTLLKRIWKKRKDKKVRSKVVVIHPNFPKNFDREIQTAGNDLYLLRGHSLSVPTLEQAQYKRSRAMLILTSENRDADSTRNTDSKAIFTVMTLDSLLDRARIYVCCMLDAEDSLRLMRAPKHPREIAFSRDDSEGLTRSESGLVKRSTSANSLHSLFGSKPGSLSRGSSSFFQRNISASNRPGSFLNRGSNLAGDRSPYLSESDELESQAHDGSQRSDKYRSEGELCERQRYASGEMIISSLFAALLVREEAQPGFSGVIRGLLGLGDSTDVSSCNADSGDAKDSKTDGSWIRLLQIPEEWTTSGRPHGKNYRETSEYLQSLGCIAIGLYRSGHAPVRWVLSSTQGIWDRGVTDVYYPEETEKSALLFGGHPRNTMPAQFPTGFQSRENRRFDDMRAHDMHHEANVDIDDLDRAEFKCPTTKRVIEYVEVPCDNVLPYVYCFPEPYTSVDPNDGIFVLCDPNLSIPADWNVRNVHRS